MQPVVLAQRLYQPIQLQLGAVLMTHRDGVVVSQTWQGLPAAMAGLVQNDVILRINGQSFEDRAYFFVQLAEEGLLTGETVEVTVRGSDGAIREVDLLIR